MSDRDWRKPLLTLMAVLNLVCWIALAGLAGLLLSDGLDIGVETLLRQGQATAAAAWERQTNPALPPARVEATAIAVISLSAVPTVGPAASAQPAPLPGGPSASPTSPSAVPGRPAADNAVNPSVQPSHPAATATLVPLATAWQPRPATASPTLHSPAAPSATPPRPVAAQVSPISLPGAPHVAVGPTQALRTLPLLLADPAFGDLSLLNAEMDGSAPGRPVQIRYQEAALNREITNLLANNSALPYHDVTIDLKRDRVVVTGQVTVLGFEVDASVGGTLTARDCQPQFEVESVSVASLVTPGFVKARIAEMLQEAMAWYPADYALCIEQIVIEETKASIYGTRR